MEPCHSRVTTQDLITYTLVATHRPKLLFRYPTSAPSRADHTFDIFLLFYEKSFSRRVYGFLEFLRITLTPFGKYSTVLPNCKKKKKKEKERSERFNIEPKLNRVNRWVVMSGRICLGFVKRPFYTKQPSEIRSTKG